MSPEDESKLFDKVNGIAVGVVRIEELQKSQSVTLGEHNIIIHGPPSNGKRSGLVTQVRVLHESNKDIKAANQRHVKWLQGQTAAVILALLGAMGVAVNHFFNGGTTP